MTRALIPSMTRGWMLSIGLGLGLALCGGLAVWPASAGESGGRYRITLVNGNRIEGEGKALADGSYEIRTRQGVVMTVRKNEIKSVLDLDAHGDVSALLAPTERGRKITRAGQRREIGDDEIAEILKGISITLEEAAAGAEDVLSDAGEASPMNEASVEAMKAIAGPNSKVYTSPHFVFVYTSSTQLARQMAARLENIYRWSVRWQEMVGVPAHAPEYKLEVFFFGTHDEYRAYMTTVGLQAELSRGFLGFYQPDINRSAFYDMNTKPDLAAAQDRERTKGLPWREREKLRARAERIAEHLNLTVTQHEAAHHIHFNTGIFNRRVNRSTLLSWHVEGLATMFEAPPSATGASFGTLNHTRIKEFRELFGRNWRQMGDIRSWISNQGLWQGFPHYSLSYALHYYLLKTKRDNYFKYMRLVAQREEEDQFTQADLIKEFEDLFGKIDDKWVEEWHKWVLKLPFKPSTIPDLNLF